MNLLPMVKSFVPTTGTCRIAELRYFRSSGLNETVRRQVETTWPGVRCDSGGETGCFSAVFKQSPISPEKLSFMDSGSGIDAYVIQIAEEEIRIDAKTASGLFYGIQTLLKMPEKTACGVTHDEAALQYRVIHWDFKGYQPKFERLLEEMRILASFKVNAILLELEDKYHYRCASEVGIAEAYSFAEMRELSRYAAELHLMIIPKLQCVAHVDYLLKHERYRNLRENGHSFQYCTTNQEAQRLWCEMADELMECFAEHGSYFHLGADEPGNLGECPECRKLGRAGSYLYKVDKCADHVLKRGRTPIIWDDILRNLHGALSTEEARECWALAKKTVVMYWEYGYGGQGNVFPFLKNYRDHGMKIWGASGFAGCDNWAGSLPPLEIRGKNIDAWTKSAIEEGLEAVVATGWTRIASADCPAEPQESSWFSILYAANSMWSGRAYEFVPFVYELFRQLYGTVPEKRLVDAILNIERNPYSLNFLDDTPIPEEAEGVDFLRSVAAAESLWTVTRTFCAWNQYYFGRLGNALPDYRVAYMKRWPAVQAGKVAALKAHLEPLLHQFYQDETVKEFIHSRFAFLEQLIADTAELTDQTREL